MEIVNGRSQRRKRTTSPGERVEEIIGEIPEIFQPFSGSPGRFTKTHQRKQQAANLFAMRQARRTTAVESCSSTPPSRDSIEFGSPLSSQNSMASQSERQQHLSPGAWTKAQERRMQQRGKVNAMNRARRSSLPPRLPILPCKLDESDETDDVAESTSISESSEQESTSASLANDASSEEAVDDDDPEGEDDEDDERDDEAGYDDDEEDEVSGACSEEEAGGEDIENVSY